MSEQLPSAQELRQRHSEKAATVEFLGNLASNTGATDYEPESVTQNRVPGYMTALRGRLSTIAPAGAQQHLEKVAAAAQEDLNAQAAEAGRIVTEHQDVYEAQARDDMTKGVLEDYRIGLADLHYFKDDPDEPIFRADVETHAARHPDILDNATREQIEAEVTRPKDV